MDQASLLAAPPPPAVASLLLFFSHETELLTLTCREIPFVLSLAEAKVLGPRPSSFAPALEPVPAGSLAFVLGSATSTDMSPRARSAPSPRGSHSCLPSAHGALRAPLQTPLTPAVALPAGLPSGGFLPPTPTLPARAWRSCYTCRPAMWPACPGAPSPVVGRPWAIVLHVQHLRVALDRAVSGMLSHKVDSLRRGKTISVLCALKIRPFPAQL